MILKNSVAFLCFCLAFGTIAVTAQNTRIVSLPDGFVRGQLAYSGVTNTTTTYYSFRGVRYAQPPTGKARFLAPVELEPWSDVYDATTLKNSCYQVNSQDNTSSEDCLFLNIFTPKIQADDLLPVLFYIHGPGGFVSGDGQYNSPDFFMDYNVILVVANYRLGPFGFASTGDDVIPGNAGLKDQNLALKWVNKNIEYFGGDPNKVTLFGQGAGSASASYHILSPKSAGLFQAAILESGSALTPWAYQRDQKSITYTTASFINSTTNVTGLSSQEIFDLLLSADSETIHNASSQIVDGNNIQVQQGYFFAPVIEPEGDDAFLTKSMYELYESGEFNKVPVIIGINAEEAAYLNADWFHWTQEAFDADVTLVVPYDMHLSEGNKTVVGQLIQEEYVGKDGTWKDNLLGSIQYFSDQSYARSIIKQAELQSNYSDVYFYVFSYHGKMGLWNYTLPGSGNVTNGEEQPYLFPMGNGDVVSNDLTEFPEEDLTVHYALLSLWTNFAKNFNPTPANQDELFNVTWPTVNLTAGADFQYLDIGKELSVKVNPNKEKYQFWQDLYNQYAVLPYDTY